MICHSSAANPVEEGCRIIRHTLGVIARDCA
jgi:hypothetical protein